MALIPYLTVHDAADAIAFYAAAFGAEESGERYTGADGTIGHAELRIGRDVFFLSDESRQHGAYAPAALGHSTSALVLTVDDVDATYDAAISCGATVDRKPTDQPWGERLGWLVDPFGHRWALTSG
ncbi:VOC family protein [Pseudactinotalea sp.]|uniref:VOC family protein n=1 Tax=Pseudactinotalea sp. TaxID=1926260 RepID=UPI003B3A871A